MAASGLNTLGLHPVGGKLAHESLQRAIDRHILPEKPVLSLYPVFWYNQGNSEIRIRPGEK